MVGKREMTNKLAISASGQKHPLSFLLCFEAVLEAFMYIFFRSFFSQVRLFFPSVILILRNSQLPLTSRSLQPKMAMILDFLLNSLGPIHDLPKRVCNAQPDYTILKQIQITNRTFFFYRGHCFNGSSFNGGFSQPFKALKWKLDLFPPKAFPR